MLFNTNKDARLNEGSCYYSKRNGRVSVRKIIDIKDGSVYFERLYGPPSQMKLGKTGATKFKRFRLWMTGEVSESADFDSLNGAEIYSTYLVQNSEGVAIFRCSHKRAEFYLSRGYAEKIDGEVIRFTEKGRKTEEMLRALYGDLSDKPFFMALKNDKCVCCGKTTGLTRHHVVPKRHKKKIPRVISCCVSNVLFVCGDCHAKYERHSEQEPNEGISDPIELVRAWSNHFISTMKPKYLPEGWDIFTLDPLQMERKVG